MYVISATQIWLNQPLQARLANQQQMETTNNDIGLVERVKAPPQAETPDDSDGWEVVGTVYQRLGRVMMMAVRALKTSWRIAW